MDSVTARARWAYDCLQGFVEFRVTPNLYKMCKDGVLLADELRQRDLPPHDNVTVGFTSLMGQQAHGATARARQEHVLAVLIQRSGAGWKSHTVIAIPEDHGVGQIVVWSPMPADDSTDAFPTREEAESAALATFAALGCAAKPAHGYVPEPNPDNFISIRVGDQGYRIPRLPEAKVKELFAMLEEIDECPLDYLLVDSARMVLEDGVERNPSALVLLAHAGWEKISAEILENYCALHGIEYPVPPAAA